ncbi:uncharacterized protein LOC123562831 [Mercenaria mercenaria]|uniref:uncharacterized protein LOC123562831 n=1 Tax=Mercenaria mercenaria TaxID=6596 RepID=UPI001E1D2D54|nr:uncharacterized protein LOC123562831 [Mercenaria mercenaria]
MLIFIASGTLIKMHFLVSFFVSFIYILSASAQNFPVFIGRNTPPVPNSYNVQGQFGNPNPVPSSISANRALSIVPQRGTVQQQSEPWAPGEPEWFFPSRPQQWLNSCQRRGCSEVGTHCVLWGGLCPSSVRRVPCRCQRGCRVDTHFIPFGQSRVMDRCNNICACNSREGVARCTTRRC